MPTQTPEHKSNANSAVDFDLPEVLEEDEPLDHPEPSMELQFEHANFLRSSGEREKIEETVRFEM